MPQIRVRSRFVLALVGAACLAACSKSNAAPDSPAQAEPPAKALANQPANQLVDKPAAAPANKPPSKPANKPANQQTNKPAPAAAPAVADKPAPAKTPAITLAALANRRDLWPAKVKLTKKVGLSPTEQYPAGKELDFVEIAGANLHLDSGNGLIEVPATSTDLLERASDLMASLSPEQLAITAQTLPNLPELWPTELKITRELGFSDGKKVPVGRSVQLRKFEGDQVNVFDREFKNYYTAAINETDIVTRARELVKLGESERTPFFLRSIAATLQPSGDAQRDASLMKADYVLVYSARLECTRCAAFMPQLKSFYERMKPAHPNFEAVFVSQDFKAEDAKALDAREHLPGRIVAYDKRLEAADLGTQVQNGSLLPLVWIYDRSGKLVGQNQQSGGKPSAEDLLATLEKKLGEKR